MSAVDSGAAAAAEVVITVASHALVLGGLGWVGTVGIALAVQRWRAVSAALDEQESERQRRLS